MAGKVGRAVQSPQGVPVLAGLATGFLQILPPEKACSIHCTHLLSQSLPYFLQSEIEKLKAENDRLKSESQGSGCSRAPSQVSISASPRQSLGLSQHSLNLPESTSLGEWLAAWGQVKSTSLGKWLTGWGKVQSTSLGKWLIGPAAGHGHQPD